MTKKMTRPTPTPTTTGPSSARNVFQGFDNYPDTEDMTTTTEPITTAVPVVRSTHPPGRDNGGGTSPPIHSPSSWFTPKFQSSTKNDPICGIRCMAWFQLLYHRKYQIEWTTYWPRILVVTLLSILNSIFGCIEYWLYETQIQSTQITIESSESESSSSPIFILGHPRTGTTLLHSLLALNEEEFITCTTFCSGFPFCFLWFESIGKKLFSNIIDKTRPMDNVPLHFDLPQEDELATNILSGCQVSPYNALFFMSQEKEFRPYYAFADADTHTDVDKKNGNKDHDQQLLPDEMASARRTWTTSFLYLLKKLTLRSQLQEEQQKRQRKRRQGQQQQNTTEEPSPRKRLLLKSPVHTARIPLLLQLFPTAQFIYIHRHPYDVLQSAIHMADTTYWYTYLNTPTNDEIMEFILRQYEILWDQYESSRIYLSTNQLIEISFDELTQQPIQVIENIYQQLEWKSLSVEYRERLEKELKDVQDYQRNKHKELSPELKALVQQRWGESFDRLGYRR